MPSEAKAFRPFPHDWQSADYVAGWIDYDIARDPERRPLLRKMLASAPFARDAQLEVLDVGGGYGVVGHLTALRAAGFGSVECTWQDPPRAIVVATRTDH